MQAETTPLEAYLKLGAFFSFPFSSWLALQALTLAGCPAGAAAVAALSWSGAAAALALIPTSGNPADRLRRGGSASAVFALTVAAAPFGAYAAGCALYTVYPVQAAAYRAGICGAAVLTCLVGAAIRRSRCGDAQAPNRSHLSGR